MPELFSQNAGSGAVAASVQEAKPSATAGENDPKELFARAVRLVSSVRKEAERAIVNQKNVVDGILMALACDGHVLVEGMPGEGKVFIAKTLSRISGCGFKRIQFTPDLLPTDLIGITTYQKEKGFYFVPGPIFANVVLANGINRAPQKVQSALLEAMQERQVTVGLETHMLPSPFFVVATQNPVESLGSYPLPEAQLDRFIFKIIAEYNDEENERKILDMFESDSVVPLEEIRPVLNAQKILELQTAVKGITINEATEKYIVSLIDATRNPGRYGLKSASFIQWGASPRASIALYIGAKADALFHGKNYATPQNVKNVAQHALRHRILLNYEGQAAKATPEGVIEELIARIPIP
ncbi:MoxR family ATPase [Candidatus Micrarchaeota archaeon]|nr:MoxR family ATPase [Candidatus Micrarchaeota archaeon]MBI5177060.1 MoxR family ATPase [Candidatus Micrarchaeota archaeon]